MGVRVGVDIVIQSVRGKAFANPLDVQRFELRHAAADDRKVVFEDGPQGLEVARCCQTVSLDEVLTILSEKITYWKGLPCQSRRIARIAEKRRRKRCATLVSHVEP